MTVNKHLIPTALCFAAMTSPGAFASTNTQSVSEQEGNQWSERINSTMVEIQKTGNDILNSIDTKFKSINGKSISFTTSDGGKVSYMCTDAQPTVNLNTCEELGLSQPKDVSDHPAYYINPNIAGCDLSLSIPGLPNFSFSGMLDFGMPDFCKIANEYLQEATGDLTSKLDDYMNQAWQISEDSSVGGGIVEGSVGGGIGISSGNEQTITFGSNESASSKREVYKDNSGYDGFYTPTKNSPPKKASNSVLNSLYE